MKLLEVIRIPETSDETYKYTFILLHIGWIAFNSFIIYWFAIRLVMEWVC